MRKSLSWLISFALLFVTPLSVFAATPKTGSTCSKLNLTQITGGFKFTCIKSGKKLVWSKAIPLTPNRKPEATSTITPDSIADPKLTERSLFATSEKCKLIGAFNEPNHLAFQKFSSLTPSTGDVRIIVIFVYFNDIEPDLRQISEWKDHQIPRAERDFQLMSYGKLKLKIDFQEKFYKINRDSIYYKLNTAHDDPPDPDANAGQLIIDGMRAADSDVDFSKYSMASVVTPISSNILYEGYTGFTPTSFDGKNFGVGLFGSIREYLDKPLEANWAVHEIGHSLGLPHPYSTLVTRSSGNAAWDAMGYPLTFAPDFLGWAKWTLSWLEDNQIDCIDMNQKGTYVSKLSPIGNIGGTKLIVMRLGTYTAIVIESRRNSILDKIDLSEEGPLVYLVDIRNTSDQGVVKLLYNDPRTRAGINNARTVIGTLVSSEELTVFDWKVTYIQRGKDGDFIKVSN